MKVCFSVGGESKRVIEKMNTFMDNVEFYSYDSIDSMIKESSLRHIHFDRVVLSKKILLNVEDDLVSLNNYLINKSNNTSVVLICKPGEEYIASIFQGIFDSPLYTPIIVKSITVGILKDIVKENINTLKARYFREDLQEAKAVIVKSEKEDKKETVISETPKKKGFLQSLLGKNKNSNDKNNLGKVVSEVVSDVSNTSDMVSESGFGLPSESFVAGVAAGAVGVGVANTLIKDI